MAVRTEKINLKKFGIKKTVSVRMTMGQYDRMEDLGIKLLEQEQYEIEHAGEITALEAMVREKENKQAMVSFLQDTFDLTDEEIATMRESINPSLFSEAFDYVTARMRGVTDSEYQKAVALEKKRMAEVTEDPKVDSVESAD